MSVTFQSLRPILRTRDLPGTVAFWTNRLGFRCDGVSEEDGWASLSRDAVGVMVATPNAHVPFDTAGFTGSFYFTVDDVASLWDDLKSNVDVAYPRGPIAGKDSVGCEKLCGAAAGSIRGMADENEELNLGLGCYFTQRSFISAIGRSRTIEMALLLAAALSAASAGCAKPPKQIGHVAWQRNDRFSRADRREILEAATRAGITDVRRVSRRWHRPSDNYHALVESGQTVTGRQVTWVALVVCGRIDRDHCGRDRGEHPWIRAGDWMTSVGSIRHEARLRVFDGSWYCDVDLAEGVTDDVADVIITAVHRRILVNRTGQPDLIARFSHTPDLDGAWYYFALERESGGANLYTLHLVRDGGGVELTLRLIGDQVELVNHAFWIA